MWICSHLIPGVAGSNSSEDMDACLLCCVGIDICEELISCSEESYQFCVSNVCDMIYFLPAIWLPPDGRSTIHIYTQTINRTTQKFWKSADRAPSPEGTDRIWAV